MLSADVSPRTGLVTTTHSANGLLGISLPTATANRTVLPPAWVPHHANALHTYVQAIIQSGAHGARPGKHTTKQLIHNLTVRLSNQINNIICVLL